MYTSLLLLAMTIQATSQDGAEPTWARDYAQALKRGTSENKPIAVFLGTGDQGFTQTVSSGSLSSEVSDILSTQYICVYIDTTTPQGKRMADAFSMPSGRGIVLSDRSGVYQMFSREGALSNQEMVRQLQTNGSRTSYYSGPPGSPVGAGGYAAPGAGVAPVGSSYCPSCSGGGGRRR
jgi:hypothetical protein